jgi:acetyl esterase/lipase
MEKIFKAIVFLLILINIGAVNFSAADNSGMPSGIPDNVELVRNVIYNDSQQKMDIMLPKPRPKEALPVIVYIHGGGWNSGSKEWGDWKVASFVKDGFIGVSIDYRLSPKYTFPVQLNDCKCAIRFLRAKAKDYNINPDKIGVWGESAGGHLVALLGTTSSTKELEGDGGYREYSSKVSSVVDYFGPTQLFDLKENTYAKKAVGGMVGADYSEENIEKFKKASPIYYVSKNSAPILIMHGALDNLVPISQSQMFYDKLKNNGVDATFYIVKDAGHGFPKSKELDDLYKMTLDFFKRTLK